MKEESTDEELGYLRSFKQLIFQVMTGDKERECYSCSELKSLNLFLTTFLGYANRKKEGWLLIWGSLKSLYYDFFRLRYKRERVSYFCFLYFISDHFRYGKRELESCLCCGFREPRYLLLTIFLGYDNRQRERESYLLLLERV